MKNEHINYYLKWSIKIDNMNTKHPDYKGEDFLNSAGRDGWDEDLDHPSK